MQSVTQGLAMPRHAHTLHPLSYKEDHTDDLKQDWLDSPHWQRLYSHYGIRKPAFHYPCAPRFMRKWMTKSGITMGEYTEFTGYKMLSQYAKANPRVPLWAFLGMLMEAREPELKAGHAEGFPLVSTDPVH